jgi:hypothetical protein
MGEKLEPCPICGSADVRYERIQYGPGSVHCNNSHSITGDGVREIWNNAHKWKQLTKEKLIEMGEGKNR